MRLGISSLLLAGLLSLGWPAAAQHYDVRTSSAPGVRIANFHGFHVLPTPRRVGEERPAGRYDPMAYNSSANRILRQAAWRAFVARGYFDTEWGPDFVVAVYATTDEKLDLAAWPYGYYSAPQWLMTRAPQMPFDAGTVILDVVDPEKLEVLWRGMATIPIVADPLENANEVVQAATAIIEKFPLATPIVVGTRRQTNR